MQFDEFDVKWILYKSIVHKRWQLILKIPSNYFSIFAWSLSLEVAFSLYSSNWRLLSSFLAYCFSISIYLLYCFLSSNFNIFFSPSDLFNILLHCFASSFYFMISLFILLWFYIMMRITVIIITTLHTATNKVVKNASSFTSVKLSIEFEKFCLSPWRTTADILKQICSFYGCSRACDVSLLIGNWPWTKCSILGCRKISVQRWSFNTHLL